MGTSKSFSKIVERSPKRSSADLARLVFAVFALLAFLYLGAVAGATAGAAQETTGGGAQGGQTAPDSSGPAPEAPEIEAKSWALMDAGSGIFLDGKNPDERLAIASTTKVMAALVVLEGEKDLQRKITVPKEAEKFVGFTYSNVGLIAGESVTVKDLLVAALVPSGTDAVYTLAYALGDGSVESFVKKMNEKASSMNLENTKFDTPAGLDSPDNYSSARDLAKMSQAAMKYPAFTEIVGMAEPTIKTQTREIQLVTTNKLLYYYPAVTGIKTGTSPEAGPSLAASAKAAGKQYIAVLLNARDDEYRFEAAQTLLEYAFANYESRPLVKKDESFKKLKVPYRRGETIQLTAAGKVSGISGPGVNVERKVETEKPPDSAKAGQKLGKVEVLANGRSVGTTPLVAKTGYEKASIWAKGWYWVRGLFN